LFAIFADQDTYANESPHRQVVLHVPLRVPKPTNERRECHDLPRSRALQPQRLGQHDRKRGDPRHRRVANTILLSGDVLDKHTRTSNPAGRVRDINGIILDIVR